MRYFLAVLAAVLLAGCAISEKDNPLAPPMEGPDSAQVLVSSHPLGTTVEISEISGGKLKGVRVETAPVELTLSPNPYAFRFMKEGYRTAYSAILLGPRAYETVWVELDTVITPPPPAPRPTASISVSPETIVEGDVTIEVASTNAELGFVAPVGIFSLGGTYTDAPERTTIYTFAVFGPGGVEVASDTVTVLPAPLPEVTLNLWASRTSIAAGETVSIGWAATHADSVTLTPVAVGNVGLDGSWTDEPEEATTYTARAYRGGEVQVERSVTVEVTPRPEEPVWLTLSATPDTIAVGGLTYLVWSSNAEVVRIDRFGEGNLAGNGIRPDDPNATTMYTARAYRGGVEQAMASVTVIVTEIAPAPPDSLVINLVVDAGVTTRTDPYQREDVLFPGIELPPNLEVRVYVEALYTGDVRGQRDESFALGGRGAVETRWAYGDDPACPVVYDNPALHDWAWVYAGTMTGFISGTLIVQHAVLWTCYVPIDGLRGPDSVQFRAVRLVVYLP